MVVIRQCPISCICTNLVDDRLKTTEQVVYALTRLLGEVFVLVLVGLKQPSLDLTCPLMEVCEGSPDLMSRLQVAHSIELRVAQGCHEKLPSLVVRLVFPPLQLGNMLLKHLIISKLTNIPHGRMLAPAPCRSSNM